MPVMVMREQQAGLRSPPLQPVVPLASATTKKSKKQGLFKVSAALRKLSGLPLVDGSSTGSRKTATIEGRGRPAIFFGSSQSAVPREQRMKRSNSVGSRRDSLMMADTQQIGSRQNPRTQTGVRVLRRHHSTYVERRPLGSSPPLPPLPTMPTTHEGSPDGFLPVYTAAAPTLDMPDFRGLGIAIEQDLIVAGHNPNSLTRSSSSGVPVTSLTQATVPSVSPVEIRPLTIIKRESRALSARPVSTATIEITLPQLKNPILPVVEPQVSSKLSSSVSPVSRTTNDFVEQRARPRVQKAQQVDATKRHTVAGSALPALREVHGRQPAKATSPSGVDMSKYCLRPTVSVACQTPHVWSTTPASSAQRAARPSTPPQAYSSFSALLAPTVEDMLPPPPPPASTKYLPNIAHSPSIYSFVSPIQRPTAGFVRQNSTLATPTEEIGQPQLEFTPTASSYARMPSSPSPPLESVQDFRRQSLATQYHPSSTTGMRRDSMFIAASCAPARPATVVNPGYYTLSDGTIFYDEAYLPESMLTESAEETKREVATVKQLSVEDTPSRGSTPKPTSPKRAAPFDNVNPFTAVPCGNSSYGLEEDLAPEDLLPLSSQPNLQDSSSDDEADSQAHSPIITATSIRRASIVSASARSSAVRRASLVPAPGSRRGSASSNRSPRSSVSSASSSSHGSNRDDAEPPVPAIPRKFSQQYISATELNGLEQRRSSEPLAALTTRRASNSSPLVASFATDLSTPRARTTPLSVSTADRLSKSRSFFLVQALENQQRRASLAFEAKQAAKLAKVAAAQANGEADEFGLVSSDDDQDDDEDESVLSDETESVLSV
ncbi:hypothetical protein OIO90_002300 [Microbotryomycetes sp. JL221]|nr:hypothetical protein OIO90_002300 [Microbotryomycetes sp. JL221]